MTALQISSVPFGLNLIQCTAHSSAFLDNPLPYLFAGILPFSYKELFFILNGLWLGIPYNSFDSLLLVFVLLTFNFAASNILFAHHHFSTEVCSVSQRHRHTFSSNCNSTAGLPLVVDSIYHLCMWFFVSSPLLWLFP